MIGPWFSFSKIVICKCPSNNVYTGLKMKLKLNTKFLFWLLRSQSARARTFSIFKETFCCMNDLSYEECFCTFSHPFFTKAKFDFSVVFQNQLPFLDILLTGSHDTCTTSTYHKPTYTGLLTNYFSFTPLSYKTGLIRTRIDRAYKINTDDVFQQDLKNDTFILLHNSFPLHFTKLSNDVTKLILTAKQQLKRTIQQTRPTTTNSP